MAVRGRKEGKEREERVREGDEGARKRERERRKEGGKEEGLCVEIGMGGIKEEKMLSE